MNSVRQARQGSLWHIGYPDHCKLSTKALFIGPAYKAACLWVLEIAVIVNFDDVGKDGEHVSF